jgi:molybdopterin/thiamine biosynthesis adenylyltransferase
MACNIRARLADWLAPAIAASDSWRPVLFRLSDESDRRALMDLIGNSQTPLQIFNTILLQLRDLIQSRNPAGTISAAALDSLTGEHLRGASLDVYGVWAYYPWSTRLVHLLDEDEFVELRTNRNRNKITTAEQARIASKCVGIVGLSVGQSIAATIALERSAGEFRLADFDRIDLSNLNRLRSGVHCIGVPKAIVTAREIAEIDPFFQIEIFPDGITETNLDAFLLGRGKLDALVEECDSLDIEILIRDRARALGIPVVMATSDRGMLDIERFDEEPGRAILHGLAGDLDPHQLKGLTTEQKAPHVGKLIELRNASTRLQASLLEIEQTITTWPQLASNVTSGAGAAADFVRRILLGESVPSGRFFIDHYNEEPIEFPAPAALAADNCGSVRQDPLVREIVTCAVLAPSGGNTQPWKWVAAENELDLFIDRERTSTLDFGGSGSFTALGCAAENLILAAHHVGMEVSLEPVPSGPRSDHAATFRLLRAGSANCEPHRYDDLYHQIAFRHTNRKIGVRQTLASEVLTDLTGAVRSIPSVDVQWLMSDKELEQVGELIGMVDRLRFLSPSMHRELFAELRWTKAEAAATGDGIDVDSLELSPSDRLGLEIVRDRRALDLVKAWGGGRKLEGPARRAIAASSAVGLIVVSKSRSRDFFDAGRAFQRLWLTATKQAISVHPMAALPYLMARVKRAGGEGLDDDMAQELTRLRPRWEELFNNPPESGEVMLFRIGTGSETETRSLRRPLDQVLSERRQQLAGRLVGSN